MEMERDNSNLDISRELKEIDTSLKNLIYNVYDLNTEKKENYNDDYLKQLAQAPSEKKEEIFKLIIENLKSQNSSLRISQYIEILPAELRLKYVDLYDFGQYNSYNNIINGITDNQIIYKLLVHALAAEKHNFNIINIFDRVPLDYKEDFLHLIAEKEKKLQNNIIEAYNLKDYLLKFSIEQRPHVIKNIIFKDFKFDCNNQKNIRISTYRYKTILETLIEDGLKQNESKMYDVFLFLLDDLKQNLDENNEQRKIFNPEELIIMFLESGYDAREIIKVLIDKDVVESYSIPGINKKLPENIKKDFAIFTIDYCIHENKKLSDGEFYSFLCSLKRNEYIELFYKYVIKEKTYDYKYILEKTGGCLFFANQLASLMSREEFNENFDRINNLILLNQIKFDFVPGYETLIKVYSEKYGVDYEGLYKFIQNFGFTTLKYLTNQNIKKYINLPSDKLDKLLKIFNDNNYYFNKSIKNDIINSLYQREFMMKEKDIYNIFSEFEKLIANGDSFGVINLLEIIKNSYDINIILVKNNISYEEFYQQTMDGNLDFLHQITNRFIAIKREEYIKEKLFGVDNVLIMDKVISKDSYKKDLIESHAIMIDSYLNSIDENLFSSGQLFLVKNKEILKEIIRFKQKPKEFNLNPEYRKYLKTFGELLDILYDNKKAFYAYDPDNENQQHLTFDLVQQEVDSNYLLGILLESNYDGLCNVIGDENLYLKLNEFLYKYKILGWQHTFNNILESCDMDYNEGTLAGLLSNFDKIVDKIENKATLTSIIDYSNCYSSSSKTYSLLFGRENFNLIAANSGKNKASMSKHDRLNKNMKLINKMYERKFITTPAINETFVLEDDKSIDVVLGNTTNMMNLTYGERTNACMRQGGAFNDLFHYCIEDENGFHIRFSNPRTGNFVSRVSGLRNGNTLFLNELRLSIDDEYTSKDLCIAIKKVAQYLIALSKNSNVPIDNVIITTDYALESESDKEQELGLNKDEMKNALNGISFNFGNKGLVLATSNDDNSLVEYNFDIELPKYDIQRDNVKVYKGQSAVERILQLTIINHLLNGVKIDDIHIENSIEEPEYLVSGEDFYIAFKNGNTNIFVFDKSKENKKTLEEIQKILDSNYNIEDDQVRRIGL